MDKIDYYAHKIKYTLQLYRIEYLQKYYSNSKEPRIIQNKLTKKLTSLRMFPRDRFRKEPGEFLKVQKTKEDTSQIQLINLDDSLILNSAIMPIESRQDVDGEYLSEEGQVQNEQPEERKGTQSPELNSSQVCECECHSSIEQEVGTKLQKQGKRRFFNFPGKLSKILIPSPIIEIESSLVTPKEPSDENLPMIPYKLPQKLLGSIENLLSDKSLKDDVRRHSYTEGVTPFFFDPKPLLSNNETDDNNSLQEQSNREKEVWKTVLNDVSLSAARISTGGTPVNAEEFANLTSDFVDSKIYEDVISLYNYTD